MNKSLLLPGAMPSDHAVVHNEIQHPALFLHIDGENAGQWVPGTAPIDGHGRPVQRVGEPDPRYREGINAFQLLHNADGSIKYHQHADVEGDVVDYALYKQMYTMTLAHTTVRGYTIDKSQKFATNVHS